MAPSLFRYAKAPQESRLALEAFPLVSLIAGAGKACPVLRRGCRDFGIRSSGCCSPSTRDNVVSGPVPAARYQRAETLRPRDALRRSGCGGAARAPAGLGSKARRSRPRRGGPTTACVDRTPCAAALLPASARQEARPKQSPVSGLHAAFQKVGAAWSRAQLARSERVTYGQTDGQRRIQVPDGCITAEIGRIDQISRDFLVGQILAPEAASPPAAAILEFE